MKVKQNILNTKVKKNDYMIKLTSVGIAVLVCCYNPIAIPSTNYQSNTTPVREHLMGLEQVAYAPQEQRVP